jgi:hypothetical protein
MARRMPVELQVRKIREYLVRQGYDPQAIDIRAEIDPRLGYRANLRHIKSLVVRRVEPGLEETLSQLLYTAQMLHEHRSERAQLMDDRFRARHTLTRPKPNPRTIRFIERWMKHPERYDIEGIDAGHITRRLRRSRARRRGRRG